MNWIKYDSQMKYIFQWQNKEVCKEGELESFHSNQEENDFIEFFGKKFEWYTKQNCVELGMNTSNSIHILWL